MDSDRMPVYGTPDGAPLDDTVPVYGTPESRSPEQERRPPFAPHRSILGRVTRGCRRLARRVRRIVGASDPDWSEYPGLVAGDSDTVLSGIRLDEVIARNERILSRIRRALEVEFRVHWWPNTDREALEELWNAWGGTSLLRTARSSTWRTTSGLTSGEDRDMATRIVGVALTHEGFADQRLSRFPDEWLLTARSDGPPESTVVLRVGFSEFALTLDSTAALAAENEAEFRYRAKRFSTMPAAD